MNRLNGKSSQSSSITKRPFLSQVFGTTSKWRITIRSLRPRTLWVKVTIEVSSPRSLSFQERRSCFTNRNLTTAGHRWSQMHSRRWNRTVTIVDSDRTLWVISPTRNWQIQAARQSALTRTQWLLNRSIRLSLQGKEVQWSKMVFPVRIS